MDEQEIKGAAGALIDWLRSQDISEEDSVPILTHAIRAIVHAVAKNKKQARRGLDIVANTLVRED